MSKIEETLWTDYKKVTNQIDGLAVNTDGYKVLLDERDKIRNELIDINKFDQETDVKISQIECDNMKDKIHNIITVTSFVVTTGVSVYAISKTFKFDQVATITSTLGRNILNGVIPKMGKR